MGTDQIHTTTTNNPKIFILKLLSGWINTGKQKQKQFQDSALCPSCSLEEEDIQHMLTCPHNSTKEIQDQFKKKLQKYKMI